mgnify:CR=1 FL=1
MTVAANAVGNGTAQAMTTDSPRDQQLLRQLRLLQRAAAAAHRRLLPHHGRQGSGSVSVTATGAGITRQRQPATHLPFSQISWTSSGNGRRAALPAGTFTGGAVQTIGTIAQNQWAESCWTFSY